MGSPAPYLVSVDGSPSRYDSAKNPHSSGKTTIKRTDVARDFGLAHVRFLSVKKTGSGLVKSAKATSAKGKTASLTGVQLGTELTLRSESFTVK
jgi:stage II sporulation protein D